MKALLGKKMHMTQFFNADGTVIPVTLVEAGPCVVTDVKTQESDGYVSIQLGFGTDKHVKKAQSGAWKELGAFELVREFRTEQEDVAKRGDVFDVTVFVIGDHVDVTGTSKGLGFQGVVKRHGFHGGPASHGHKDNLRMPGSIGAGGVQRVFKGMRMGGRMGSDRVTVKNLEIVQIDATKHVLAIKGALPGATGSLVMIEGREGKSIWDN
ncbi:MAG: 50S ribosomal protein L3 [Patescibacteria group bacterium]